MHVLFVLILYDLQWTNDNGYPLVCVLFAGYHCEWLVKNTVSAFDEDTHRQEVELHIFQLVAHFMQERHSINLIGHDLVRLEVCSHTRELIIYFGRGVQLHAYIERWMWQTIFHAYRY